MFEEIQLADLFTIYGYNDYFYFFRLKLSNCACVHLVGQLLSMGYGFVEFKRPSAAKEALKLLQHTMLDGHQLELKLSNRTTLWVLFRYIMIIVIK